MSRSSDLHVIYEPRGRALEYSLLAANLYRGCQHGCSYCYAPSALRMRREQFHKEAQARKNLMPRLRRDAERLAGTNKRVLLCFSCDPYQPLEAECGLTHDTLEIFKKHDIPFQVLTKNGPLATQDFGLYGPNDAFATTLTFDNAEDSRTVEPGAALPEARIDAIRVAHGANIRTWVSLEPVIDPAQSLALIERTVRWVDLYKIGKLNHDKARESQIDWRAFGMNAITLCERHGKPYYVKNDLAAHLEGVRFTSTDTRKVDRPEKPAGKLFC